MKRILFILACAAMMACAGGEKGETEMEKKTGDLTAFDVQKEFAENGFTWFTKNLILCVGDTDRKSVV